ncbi:tryptophan synthase subunit alpha [Polynucleobacter kasalickyi]|uniref:Tryptophan synthase alpha chain n=1 Tax=Polynucleobacter kasalickyi TaxID=1938817 RepID=A0A1W1ZDR1_9BURK|nr:tryptophan synthase subunit alpha [Polynucleobacter kasalickyi]SMC46517.1 tryptophan synthase, alpha chain [Polynucleobacter kasalickyi]
MSRIKQVFENLAKNQKKGLIPFITAGDPDPEMTVEMMHVLVDAGADVIELGIPFSDPMADGPVIQRASERALVKGVNLEKCVGMVKEFRLTNQHTPIVLMGYANPIERMGWKHFAEIASSAGVDGVLIVDYPPEECVEFTDELKKVGIDPIFLLAPTSTMSRIEQVAHSAQGYIYYVSLKGVTGAANLNTTNISSIIGDIREKTSTPIAVGFGIRDAKTAKAVSQTADAVVIGSAIVQLLESAPPQTGLKLLKEFLSEIRSALDA